ncbi:MAG TPA: YceI family protein [Mycobacteriales bacterium]|jgi:polyisoprenoid-binding protein YceI|nr:YceI family protein [Mycobacteriales bacterium]
MTTETVSTTTTSLTGDYDVDPAHSRVGFAAKHAMVTTVRGHFADFTSELHLDDEHVENSTARIEIRTASLDTGNAQRDEHVRNSDFLDVENFPTITFVSTQVEQTGEDTYAVTGDLTVKDVTKPVTVAFEKTGAADDPWGNFRVGFEGGTVINRKDFGVNWNVALEAGGILVSDKVRLEFDIAAVRRK